jgi:NitT/TauT family transport system ATP-binding protein
MSGEKLTVRNVSKTFVGDGGQIVTAINDMSFSVAENELVALVGPAGCGKSTLLSIIAGDTEPSSGVVLVDDDLVRGPGHARGVVLQTSTLFPWMSVRANIEFALREEDLPRADRRRIADEQVVLLDLSSVAEAMPGELSGDLRERVAVAHALAQRPQVLLMDEPFAVLRASAPQHVHELLARVRRERPLTVLLATRDLDETMLLPDRVLHMARVPGGVG